MSEAAVIVVSNLSKSFGNIRAVNDLSMTINSGDIYGLLGPNGSGKSTTIRMILSLIAPDSGKIVMFGSALRSGRKRILGKIGALVEKPDFYEYLSAIKNLEILSRYSGRKPEKADLEKALDTAGLIHRSNSRVKTFSKGMKQRLGIAQALLNNPDLIILDEPSSGLDPAGTKEIRELIVRLNRDLGKTIVLSSHNLREVEVIANRMILINRGEKVIEDEVRSVLKQYPFSTAIETDDPVKSFSLLSEAALDLHHLKKEGDKILMTCHAESAAIANRILIENGIKVYSLAQERSLEQYFLNMT